MCAACIRTIVKYVGLAAGMQKIFSSYHCACSAFSQRRSCCDAREHGLGPGNSNQVNGSGSDNEMKHAFF